MCTRMQTDVCFRMRHLHRGLDIYDVHTLGKKPVHTYSHTYVVLIWMDV